MKLFFSYLKMHIKSIILFCCFAVIFAVISALYSVPTEAVIYAFVLCGVLAIIVCVISFFRFRTRHKSFQVLLKNISDGIDNLPEARDIRDEDYTQIIKQLQAEKAKCEFHEAMTVRDMNDYYTLWVHQIKTPIAAMNLLLQQKNEDELSGQLFRINEYVEMVLTYIRCGSDSSDYVLKKCKLDNIIKASVRKYAKSFIMKKISLSYTDVNMTVLTDEKWLGFVIEQVLSNALKYTKEGSISIYTDGTSSLVIEDTGIGIAKEDLPRVCEKGYTGYNGREDRKSTGIGLFLCKKVLDSLGHTLKIVSETGKGTKVIIGFKNPNIRYE